MGLLSLAGALLAFFAVPTQQVDLNISWSALTLDPEHETPCQPTEITVSVELKGFFKAGDSIYVKLAGFTNGACANAQGYDVELGSVLLWPSSAWKGQWTEGTVAAEFADSMLYLVAQEDVRSVSGLLYKVVLDISNSIRPNCGLAQNSGLLQLAVHATTNQTNATIARTYQRFNQSDGVNGSCYLTDTELLFQPAQPKETSKITVTFTPAQALANGDVVVVQMSGWTSGVALGAAGDARAYGDVGVRDSAAVGGNTSDYFEVSWVEGSYEQHVAGFANSTLYLRVLDGVTIAAGTAVALVVLDGQFRPQCGMPAQYERTQLGVLTAANTSDVAMTVVAASSAVGDGCLSLEYCSSNGRCDYCLNRCECFEGFGAVEDESTQNDFSNWNCGEPACPHAPSWGGMTVAGFAHAQHAECSDAGICQRSTGTCQCFEQFAGGACERRVCAGYVFEVGDCSGHGMCANMRGLSLAPDALPLTSKTNRSYAYAASEFPSGVWDQRRLFGCICDSSWTVGLAAGETQEPEFFGPDCSLMHCPSGDDPMTRHDETDCTNVTATGGRGIGQQGNLCHVDCANRGMCDYLSGVCTCFAGFYGADCTLYSALATRSYNLAVSAPKV